MGIPRLKSCLESYATATSRGAGSITRTVIDGPALAYHVYYTGVLGQPSIVTPPSTLPWLSPVQQVGNRVLEWLLRLERCGMIIERIYFDGALPPTKEETRQARLRSSLQQLLDFRRLHPSVISAADTLDQTGIRSRPGRTALPAPAFLVPLVLEALRSSVRFAGVTKVIPGEADVYCASHVREIGGLVLTNDSDLLVYNLGAEGQVAFFPDIDFIGKLSDLNQDEFTCRYLSYRPLEIAKCLDLDPSLGLAAFGFEVERDVSRRMPDLVQRAMTHSADQAGADLKIFLKRYQTLDETLSSPGEEDCWWDSHQCLDPRVSELVCRYRLSIEGPSQEDITMYLPFLPDDPTRSSAWKAGAQIRTLAYSILNDAVSATQQRTAILEIVRRGQRIGATDVELLSSHSLGKSIKDVVSRFESIRAASQDLDISSLWTIIAFQDIVESAPLIDEEPPTQQELIRLLDPTIRPLDWPTFHLYAQFQAVHYSWRILSQLLDFVLKTDLRARQASCVATSATSEPEDNATPDGKRMEDYRMLKKKLESLPSLTQGLPNRQLTGGTSDLNLDEIMAFVLKSCSLEDDLDRDENEPEVHRKRSTSDHPHTYQSLNAYTLVPKKTSKKARNKQNRTGARENRRAEISVSKPANPFSILDDMSL
ncbi:MAG: hypothetical protein M1823_001327 [Watsoniomyces obsoletus]|nr:MAG: hypothetical protein M1823_001327 [Watsoniomyces obsoletus]